MPEGATTAQRIDWYLEHAKHCAGRPSPQGLLAKLKDEQRRQLAREFESRQSL